MASTPDILIESECQVIRNGGSRPSIRREMVKRHSRMMMKRPSSHMSSSDRMVRKGSSRKSSSLLYVDDQNAGGVEHKTMKGVSPVKGRLQREESNGEIDIATTMGTNVFSNASKWAIIKDPFVRIR